MPRAAGRFGMALVCPVTRGGAFARGKAWTVALAGLGLQSEGSVLCNQVKTLDWQAHRAEFIERAPVDLVADVIGRVFDGARLTDHVPLTELCAPPGGF